MHLFDFQRKNTTFVSKWRYLLLIFVSKWRYLLLPFVSKWRYILLFLATKWRYIYCFDNKTGEYQCPEWKM